MGLVTSLSLVWCGTLFGYDLGFGVVWFGPRLFWIALWLVCRVGLNFDLSVTLFLGLQLLSLFHWVSVSDWNAHGDFDWIGSLGVVQTPQVRFLVKGARFFEHSVFWIDWFKKLGLKVRISNYKFQVSNFILIESIKKWVQITCDFNMVYVCSCGFFRGKSLRPTVSSFVSSDQGRSNGLGHDTEVRCCFLG